MFADALRHHQAGRLVDAAVCYRQILAADSRHYPEVHMNLGLALLQLGKLDDAATSYRRALELRPNDIEGLLNLGNILGDLGRPDEAMACYRKALVIKPDFPDVHNSLGVTLHGLGLLDEAVASYRHALAIKPDFVMALNNLAATLVAQGKPLAALDIARRSLQIEETDETKGLLASCLSHARDVAADAGLRPLMVRALSEHWGWPSSVMHVCIDLLRLDHDISGRGPLSADGLAALATDPLLSALLDAAPICDADMERFLTTARRNLLDAAQETSGSVDGIGFYSALARQCFINEYVFAVTADEARKAGDLRNSLAAALASDAAVPSLWLPAVAAYFPLCSVPLSARLLERSWPMEIAALLTQQVGEPTEEHRIAAAIRPLTAIEDDISLLVQRQYEENPYPRWVKVPPSAKADSIEAYLRRAFPLAAFDRPPASSRMEILVAGCGTGQQSIRASRQFPQARILAVDLSRSSLAYAVRKTRELNISSIEYTQADLLKLGSLGRQFDVITAGGVLHHLADPWTGWRTLLSLLHPGGFMLLGLYSKVARRDVSRLRHFIAERGYGTTADEIRRCRQDLTAAGGIGSADGRPSDLFTISGVRDLLFHVQEHPVTLAEIASFLEENDLAFLGFDISADVLQSYRSRFPEDRAATNLAQWQLFENENPDTFVGMYQFWIQKRR
jgi:Flp pilus assembly protein TadD/2-polyprenyl-3-methyl-5-hydroxy-6-metoxy-1,4-benzoquinol methylase